MLKSVISKENLAPLVLLLLPVLFNLYVLFPENKAKTLVNDHAFQFGLVERANKVLDEAYKECGSNPLRIACYLPPLFDHWVPDWAEGYPLPFYYQHVPHLAVVVVYKLFAISHLPISPLDIFLWFQYLTLSLFPLAVYKASRYFNFSKKESALIALPASYLASDFLYGSEWSSFIWRGYGLWSQTMAMFFLPLALGSVYQTITKGVHHVRSILLLFLTFSSQVLFGYIVLFSLIPMVIQIIFNGVQYLYLKGTKNQLPEKDVDYRSTFRYVLHLIHHKPYAIRYMLYAIRHLLIVLIPTFLLLAYWLIPLALNNQYHGRSVWDPPWKWDSYGLNWVLENFVNGNVLDFGRLPILTLLSIVGFLAAAYKIPDNNVILTPNVARGKDPARSNSTPRDSSLNARNDTEIGNCLPAETSAQAGKLEIGNSDPFTPEKALLFKVPYLFFVLLFILWFFLFMGRPTLGFLLDKIPLTAELHLSRLVNGFHLAAIFLIGIGLSFIIDKVSVISSIARNPVGHTSTLLRYLTPPLLLLLLLLPVFKDRYKFASDNSQMIYDFNPDFEKEAPDFKALIDKAKENGPGRFFIGKAGQWGKDFNVGKSKAYLQIPRYDTDMYGFLPETWSLNSDPTEFFYEDDITHYNLLNIKYVIRPKATAKKNSQIEEPPPIPSFYKPLGEKGNFELYKVDTTGYFDVGTSSLTVHADKENRLNLLHLWLGGPLLKQKSYLNVILSGSEESRTEKSKTPFIKNQIFLTSDATYTPDPPSSKTSNPPLSLRPRPGGDGNLNRTQYNYLQNNPLSTVYNEIKDLPLPEAEIKDETVTYNSYSANLTLTCHPESAASADEGPRPATKLPTTACPPNTLAILKVTYHPQWKATIDGKPAEILQVSPSYMAIPITEGPHQIVFTYQSSPLKKSLMAVSFITLIILIVFIPIFPKLRKLKTPKASF